MCPSQETKGGSIANEWVYEVKGLCDYTGACGARLWEYKVLDRCALAKRPKGSRPIGNAWEYEVVGRCAVAKRQTKGEQTDR